LVAVGFVPKPLLFASVLHAKPFDFLHRPLKLGMKYVGHPNQHLLALGVVFVCSIGPKGGLFGESRVFSFFHGPWSAHERAGDQLCGKEGERVQLRFLLEVIECSCYVSWLG
jgi:hypothetical protein